MNEESKPESGGHEPGAPWRCDVCQVARFATYEEAVEHERVCTKGKVTNIKLVHHECQEVGLAFINRGPESGAPSLPVGQCIVVSEESRLLRCAGKIRAVADALFLPNCNTGDWYEHWEKMEPAQLTCILTFAGNNMGHLKNSYSDFNEGAMRAALRGSIRPGDILTKIKLTTINGWSLSFDGSLDYAQKLTSLLDRRESYPVKMSLQRTGAGASRVRRGENPLHEIKRLILSANTFVQSADWSRLLSGLSQMHLLEGLSLDRNNIGRDGCDSIATLLKKEGSSLKCLNLTSNLIDDECMSTFADALRNNDTLQTLNLSGNERITSIGWNHVLNVLCDESSIENTYLSNHTLRELGVWGQSSSLYHDKVVGEKLTEMLRCNKPSSGMAPGRTKMWRVHFNTPLFDLQPVLDIDVQLMPRVLALFANPGSAPSGYPRHFHCKRLYHLIRGWNLPELFVYPTTESLRFRRRITELELLVATLKEENELLKEKNGCDDPVCPSKKRRVEC